MCKYDNDSFYSVEFKNVNGDIHYKELFGYEIKFRVANGEKILNIVLLGGKH